MKRFHVHLHVDDLSLFGFQSGAALATVGSETRAAAPGA